MLTSQEMSFSPQLLQIGTILKRDKANCKVAVELVQTREVVTLDYDDVCEYVGNIEELM